jgi:uncharacterized membrane protein
MSMNLYKVILTIGVFNWIVVDIISTVVAIKYGNAYEANLIGRYAIKNIGLIPGLVTIKTIALIILIFIFYRIEKYDDKIATYAKWYLAIFIFLVGTLVSVHNFSQVL